ncbi:nucleolar complex-associated protein 3 [Malania oleifera]|uniref:nucleolar complex-associated protein 3 n=1 Tax=Malania oleifera TaxID=397392 RepID=UPI0025AE2A4D|nr:nucleolar complex-associated protein 3 [Malania oleifera]
MGKKQRIILPPELPPEPLEDEIEVSDEDLQFVTENRDYAGFVSSLDTQLITRHVRRVADVKEDALEALYEKRLKKKSLENDNKERKLQVDPVDALPVKTLDGKLYYRTVPKASNKFEGVLSVNEAVGDDEGDGVDKNVVKLTKAERRAKLKKSKREAKKQAKDFAEKEEVQQASQAEVLAEVKEDLSAEEALEKKKSKLAELGMMLLQDPESNIRFLKEMLQICKDNDSAIVKLGLLSLLAVFKDILPGYRIRCPTEKEQEMTVSKAVKKIRFFESTLLSAYKVYLQKLIAFEKQSEFHHVAICCVCTLLDAVPHFNFRESLLAVVIKNIGSPDDVTREFCCATVKSLFSNEGKHGGEATVEAVQMIANHVKAHDCQLHPDSIEVFLSLSFNEGFRNPEKSNENSRLKNKRSKRMKNLEEPSQLQDNDKKRNRREQLTKTREEVNADYRAASLASDVMEQKQRQSETLSAVFQTYFRILKHAVHLISVRSEVNSSLSTAASGAHPLLTECLNGIGKFSHLIDLDFMGDLMNYLKKLANSGSKSDDSSEAFLSRLTVSERLQCCIVAFKVMRNNLDALNVDLKEFFVQLYNLILEYRPGRDQGEVLAEALKLMLCEDRQHDMQRTAAFIKRLATCSLCLGSAESMAALVTARHLLQKNVKCRNLLENDAGGGSVSGSVAKFQPYASDPNLAGALASVLWELNLLSKHYHPAISTMASGISGMSTSHNQVSLSFVSPQQAFMEMSLEKESFCLKNHGKKLNQKRKRERASFVPTSVGPTLVMTNPTDEDGLRNKLSDHFSLLRDIMENERLRYELDGTNISLQLYKEYKNQKKIKQ